MQWRLNDKYEKILINYANEEYRESQRVNSFTGKYIAKFDKVIECSDTMPGTHNIDEEFRVENSDILSQSRGNGLWLWKPYFINKILKEINHGDILFYCDSGSFFIRNINGIVNSMNGQNIWVSSLPLIEKQYTKMDAFIIMDCIGEEYYNTNQISASFLAVRKSNDSIEFIGKWLQYCRDTRILSPQPNVCGKKNFKEFIAHREDQSILSLLCKKNNITPHLDPSQFGRIPWKYQGKKRIFRIPKHKDTYKPIIVHHRSSNFHRTYFNQLLLALLPSNLGIKLVKKGRQNDI